MKICVCETKYSLYALPGRNRVLSVDNKLFIYKLIICAVLIYGMPDNQWEKVNVAQSVVLRSIFGAPKRVLRNVDIYRELNMTHIVEYVPKLIISAIAVMETHENPLVRETVEAPFAVESYYNYARPRHLLCKDFSI